MRMLYNSNYTGIPVYLMDFWFGGFLEYGACESSGYAEMLLACISDGMGMEVFGYQKLVAYQRG